MKVKEVMNEIVAVDKDISIKEAAKIMSDKNIGSIVVVKNGDVIGIVTEKDITKNISDSSRKISSVMNKNVVTIDSEDDIEDAAALMAKNKIKHLPVVDPETGKLAGIITATEIIEHSDEFDDDFFFK
jgi:CBS domain-containing protein